MAPRINNDLRDQLVTAFRERVCDELGIVPFEHQRKVWLASEGMELLDVEDAAGVLVQLPDKQLIRKMVTPRKQGRARFLADLGAFKIGKSYGAALWGTGFAVVPGARVALVGLEYDICAPEFDYLCEFLLSEAGMGMKYESLQNRPRDGKMWLDLPNGARYEARSWERKETLKGKENDAYIYCEAYQLPGIECFTSFSQNLRARRGYAYFATTPDRPWIKLLHELGHGADPEWHCTCSVGAEVNPHTFDSTAKKRDEMLMTREKFSIHYNGVLGDFVGRVYNYAKGSVELSPRVEPRLFPAGSAGTKAELVVPSNFEVVAAADTGTYYTALVVAFSPEGTAYVLDEFPNYRYTAGSAERDEEISIPGWARSTAKAVEQMGGRAWFWADKNSQFKQELRNYGMNLLGATAPVEARTEIAREYFQHGRIFLAPWLSVLPFELENAAWPEEATASGKFARIKDRDHTLDCLEHILARRPQGRPEVGKKTGSRWIDSFYGPGAFKRRGGNVHLGSQ